MITSGRDENIQFDSGHVSKTLQRAWRTPPVDVPPPVKQGVGFRRARSWAHRHGHPGVLIHLQQGHGQQVGGPPGLMQAEYTEGTPQMPIYFLFLQTLSECHKLLDLSVKRSSKNSHMYFIIFFNSSDLLRIVLTFTSSECHKKEHLSIELNER